MFIYFFDCDVVDRLDEKSKLQKVEQGNQVILFLTTISIYFYLFYLLLFTLCIYYILEAKTSELLKELTDYSSLLEETSKVKNQ